MCVKQWKSHLSLKLYTVFDLEAIWEEHTYFEFEVRSVAKTMGTMVVCVFAPSQIVSVTEALERLSPMLIMFQLLVLGAF